MKHTYDPEVDMHYVYLQDEPSKVHQSRVTTAVIDVDEHGAIIGFEIFGVEKGLK